MKIFNVGGTLSGTGSTEEEARAALDDLARKAQFDLVDVNAFLLSEGERAWIATGWIHGLYQAAKREGAIHAMMYEVYEKSWVLPRHLDAFESQAVPGKWVRNA